MSGAGGRATESTCREDTLLSFKLFFHFLVMTEQSVSPDLFCPAFPRTSPAIKVSTHYLLII